MPLLPLILLLTSPLAASARAFPADALTADGPDVVMEATKRDIGEVYAGEELEFTFVVRNAGTKALELKEKPSIPSGSTGAANGPSTAMWRTGERVFIPAAVRRAAPS